MPDAFHLYMLWGFPAFYIFVESFAEGRTAYLSHGFRKYFRGYSGDFCDGYLCFGKTEAHASQYKIHKEKTAILHLCFGTEKNRRLGSKKAR